MPHDDVLPLWYVVRHLSDPLPTRSINRTSVGFPLRDDEARCNLAFGPHQDLASTAISSPRVWALVTREGSPRISEDRFCKVVSDRGSGENQ